MFHLLLIPKKEHMSKETVVNSRDGIGAYIPVLQILHVSYKIAKA